jgi:DNA-binding protein H-NS
MKTINLKQFSIDDLLTLRDRINAMLESRVDRERHDLETRLKRLQRFKAASIGPRKEKPAMSAAKKLANKRNPKATKKVAPKYHNPENPSETWAGRGLQPRWLRAAMNSGGKSLEDFRI